MQWMEWNASRPAPPLALHSTAQAPGLATASHQGSHQGSHPPTHRKQAAHPLKNNCRFAPFSAYRWRPSALVYRASGLGNPAKLPRCRPCRAQIAVRGIFFPGKPPAGPICAPFLPLRAPHPPPFTPHPPPFTPHHPSRVRPAMESSSLPRVARRLSRVSINWTGGAVWAASRIRTGQDRCIRAVAQTGADRGSWAVAECSTQHPVSILASMGEAGPDCRRSALPPYIAPCAHPTPCATLPATQ